ncbi:jg18815 [Pararge aegeria aegeria]|uniref:Jg18815 protein n=1 Tax=Pararge aegeria aegeria TaxID=348720 RepID=A0A8S4QTY7_9NEOP|nr:jg18815 [Pararge aegeria aegeria]
MEKSRRNNQHQESPGRAFFPTFIHTVKRYFTSEQDLTLYQAQIRSCMEYCSHLWDGSAKYQLDALANKKLQSLEHRRKVACLSVFYRIYFGECAQELI